MDNIKEVRWKQRVENFDKSYKLLKKYCNESIATELERAGIIHFFKLSFDFFMDLLGIYLEGEGYFVKSPRETVKQAFQIGLVEDGHIWIDALSNRNLTTHTYDEELAEKMTKEILNSYLPELDKMYERLFKEL